MSSASRPPQGEESEPPQPEAKAPEAAPPSLTETLAGLLAATLARYQARLELLSLDVRRAVLSLGHLILLSLVCAFLLWTAWFMAMAGLVCLIEHLTGTYAWGILVVIVLNLALMAWLWQRAIRLTHHLTLPAVRAHILGGRHE